MSKHATHHHRDSFRTNKKQDLGPDLLEIQLKSFKDFFQIETTPDKRPAEGLFKVFSDNFPIKDTRNIYLLEFLDYNIDPPRYTIPECIERGLSYAVSLKAKLRLSCNDDEHIDFQTMEQFVYLGNLPYMTPRGTFIINGAERVIVSQLHRSPGVFFGQSTHNKEIKTYSAKVIPYKGTWIEFATDTTNVLYAYIDRKKKIPVTTLLRAMGFETDKQIFELFGMAEEIKADKKTLHSNLGKKLANRVLKTWNEDFADSESGEITTIERTETILERDTELTEDNIKIILNIGVPTILIQQEEASNDYSIIYNTLHKDTSNNEMEAVQVIYKQLRGTDSPDDETAKGIIDKLFFSEKRYDLSEVGRYKINAKLNLDPSHNSRVLTKFDIIEIIKYLVDLTNNKAEIDDIDHLSNRRVKTVGEQLSQQFSMGLSRMVRTIKERMNVRDNEVFCPTDLINAKTLTSVINTFFGTSQLSQFLDQTNPLSELTHKRRISALGPGGLSRERAGFEVRDVHYSHYGRLCPIETPEGPNIGLISTLCVHAKINNNGFIETPYYKVHNNKVSFHKEYLSAADEDLKKIAQHNIVIDENGEIKEENLVVRETGEFPIHQREKIEFLDVAPNQIMGLSASLIPFLEHNDANRALMGSNMQRQAVPLLKPESPIVGTGYEGKAARDARIQLHAEGNGEVVYVDATQIKIKYSRNDLEKVIDFNDDIFTYKLTKFSKTNQATCINLKPAVKVGQKVKKGDFLTEGYATKDGELALGRNLLVAFMPWKGYNFEDAIVINERVVREDWFTSIHIDDYELEVRDTKLGEEELTNDIPNVSEDQTKNLDPDGVIQIGTIIREGDILIGKITPKGEQDPTPEEKLLRAIFGDKAGDTKDASFRAPSGTEGTIINTKLFKRTKKDKQGKLKEKVLLEAIEKKFDIDAADLKMNLEHRLMQMLEGKVSNGVTDKFNEIKISKGVKFSTKVLQNIPDYLNVNSIGWTGEEVTDNYINILLHNYNIKFNEIYAKYRREKFNTSIGDELPAGVIKLAKVFIAVKRKLKVGDKMAGRHGNKGIVAKIVRSEDMPFLEDGKSVDIVLNPLGVPSRMNLGQIYETVLGWIGKELGTKYATPIFDGATSEHIEDLCKKAGLPRNGHTFLFDGETGDRFHQKATVGVIYMIKLHHMVDDKMHARSIGPYSLITQQPLGGKAQFGGQRFGEMEVWALEAYGASNILQELLTIKSDDIVGRSKTYEAIVRGENIPKPGTPESFNVLLHELRGLGLNLNFE